MKQNPPKPNAGRKFTRLSRRQPQNTKRLPIKTMPGCFECWKNHSMRFGSFWVNEWTNWRNSPRLSAEPYASASPQN